MKFHHILAPILFLLLFGGCALAERSNKSEEPVTPPEKIMCVDAALRTNPLITDLTLEEKPVMKRNIFGDYSYLYRFKIQNASGSVILSSPPLFIGNPEIRVSIIYKEDPPPPELEIALQETIAKLKESCPSNQVQGWVRKRRILDGCE